MRKFALTIGTCVLISAFGPVFAAPDAKTFVANAAAANTSLVKLGGVGQAKGRTTTQTFAVRLQRDFARANSDLAPLAGTLGVDATPAITPEAQAEIAKLAPLGDDDFDSAYGKALVKLLEADVAQYQAMADAKAGPASDLAAAQLPVLQKTLDGAKRIAR